MKILLSAYACEPHRGSEPGIGWNMAQAIAKHHQVCVLTSYTHRAAIEAELVHRPIPNLKFAYFDPLGWVYDWSQEGRRSQLNVHIHYYLWQIWAYFVGRSLHRAIEFHLIHHVTYVKYQTPSFLSLLPIPFVWGPVGGGESAPRSFWKGFSLQNKIYEMLRTAARWVGEHDPFVRLTVQRSAIVWATTDDTAQRLQKLGAKSVEVMSALVLPALEINQLKQQPTVEDTPVRFISMGRLLHWKGFHLGLQAFADAHLPHAEYWILGIGPEQQRLKNLARALDITHQVKFWDHLSREDSLEKLARSHVLVHPSLHDSGGWVCVEAMATGRPVICLDLGGPSVQVTAETGIKVLAQTPERATQGLAQAMKKLAHSRELRERMGQAGQQRIQEVYSWESREQHLTQIYQELVRPVELFQEPSKL
jgi:glycosyltransferase involved in cell wall biosynthesis